VLIIIIVVVAVVVYIMVNRQATGQNRKRDVIDLTNLDIHKTVPIDFVPRLLRSRIVRTGVDWQQNEGVVARFDGGGRLRLPQLE
jgi:hypothetical protein